VTLVPRGFVSPPKWSKEEMREARAIAEALFKEQRREEGPRAFAAVYAEVEPDVRRALAATRDLLELTGQVFVDDPALFQVMRYFCGPPISEEDLWTLVGGPKFKRVPTEYADETAEVIALVIDPVRFPWVEAARKPSDTEREAAVLATTTLLAGRVIGTKRRGTASTRQEAAVAAVLEQAGYNLDHGRDPVFVLDRLERGVYSRERRIAGAKCDVPVRLRDGRLLAIECKVSNGPKNGWKRVNREVGGKAETWRQQFGTQIVTAVVLAGVYDLSCLETAQEAQNVCLFWEHDLAPLAEFVNAK
jgi:XamI restriction endonuclease